jgi:glyoxylase-like metal-dependent hydrolase (beta-lactamase superfamily II)
MDPQVLQIKVGGFDQNLSYLVGDGQSEDVAVVDPSGDLKKIFDAIKKKKVNPVAVLVTHSHADHVDGLAAFLEEFPVPVYFHESGEGAFRVPKGLARPITDGEDIEIGSCRIEVLHTPGHSDDAVCYYIPEAEARDEVPKLITGDTLFVSRCGRTDEDHVDELFESLEELKTFPDETVIYPGHDYGPKPTSTIGREKEKNKFFRCETPEEFRDIRLA